jgi:hypothetical protein
MVINDEGFSIVSENPLLSHTFANICLDLQKEFNNSSIQPEKISEGGILFTNDGDKYKTMRIYFKDYPYIKDVNTIQYFLNKSDNELYPSNYINFTSEKKKKINYHTIFKSNGGLYWTINEAKKIADVFIKYGFEIKKFPKLQENKKYEKMLKK